MSPVVAAIFWAAAVLGLGVCLWLDHHYPWS